MDELRFYQVPGHEGLTWCSGCGMVVPVVPAAAEAHQKFHARLAGEVPL